MQKIGAHAINGAYEIARQVISGQIAEAAAVSQLEHQHGMNPTSATIYIRNLGLMLEGKILKRTMSAPSFAIYLDRIADDYGLKAAKKAVMAVRSHVAYYNSLGRGNLLQVREICDAADARLSPPAASI